MQWWHCFSLHYVSPEIIPHSACLGTCELTRCHHNAIHGHPILNESVEKVHPEDDHGLYSLSKVDGDTARLPGQPLSWFVHLVQGKYYEALKKCQRDAVQVHKAIRNCKRISNRFSMCNAVRREERSGALVRLNQNDFLFNQLILGVF